MLKRNWNIYWVDYMTKDKKSVAILVLSYNGEKYLERFFCFLKKQNLEYCDVYFVENGSKDESLEIAKKFVEQDKIIINKKNVGISGGFNSGLSRIIDKYEYIILLANDILVGDKWLENLMKPILEDKKNGISTSVVLQENGKVIEIGGICLFNILLGVFGHYLGFHKYDYYKLLDIDTIEYINGIKVERINEMLDKINWEKIYECAIPSNFHGDLQPENIIYNGKDFTLIDWRESFGNSLVVGDSYYDLGKLYHALFINGTDVTVSGGTTFTTTALTSGDRVLATYPI